MRNSIPFILHCCSFLGLIFLIELITGIDAMIIGGGGVISLCLLWLLIFIRTKYAGRRLEKASDYLRKITHKKVEFCLVLRPFGQDAHIPFSNLNQGQAWDRFLLNWLRPVTIEQVIENRARKDLKTETIALVDPKLNLIPGAPKYLMTDHEIWKWVVFDLLKHSLVVYIVIPPGETVRPSLHWEVIKAIQLGLLGRLAIILPPMNSPNHRQALESIKKNLFFLSPHVMNLPPNTVAFYPYEDRQSIDYWVPKIMKKKFRFSIGKSKMQLSGYLKIMSEINERVKKCIEGMSYLERHMFISKDYAEYDYNFINTDLDLFLQKPRDPFEFDKE